MPYKINAQGLPEYVQPDMDSMHGVPDYGGNYNSMLGATSQPMSLQQLISTIRNVQQAMQAQPIGNQSVSMSPLTTGQIPAQTTDALQGLISAGRNRIGGQWQGPLSTFEAAPTYVPAMSGTERVGSSVTGGATGGGGSYDTGFGYVPPVSMPKATVGGGGTAGTGGSTATPSPTKVPVLGGGSTLPKHGRFDPPKPKTTGGSGYWY